MFYYCPAFLGAAFWRKGTGQALHAAASGIAAAYTHDDLRRASQQVAKAMQAVGPGGWARFLTDAQERANEPATRAAIAATQAKPAVPRVAPAPAKAGAKPVPAKPPEHKPELPEIEAPPKPAAEPPHGKIWLWLHSLGLAETRHEQATELRRAMGSQGGLIYARDGIPLNVDQMSDDEVLALDKETRETRPGPPLRDVAAPIMTQWGWNNSPPYKIAIEEIKVPGTHKTINGHVPTRQETVRLIEESGGKVERIEEGHGPESKSTHNEPHINYYVPRKPTIGDAPVEDESLLGKKGTVIVKPWK